MKLYAISDLHLEKETNWEALTEIRSFPDDWLIVSGDLAETEKRFVDALDLLVKRFERVIWVPGNHDLWTLSSEEVPNNKASDKSKLPAEKLKGVAKYERLVSLFR